jgi:hypothetical protein
MTPKNTPKIAKKWRFCAILILNAKNGSGDDFRLMTRVLPRPLVLQGGKSFEYQNKQTSDDYNMKITELRMK